MSAACKGNACRASEQAGEFIGYHRAHGGHPVLSAARTQVTCRSRYTQDRLAEAVHRGITQYVILGAGLDSFAYRRAAGQPGSRPASGHSKSTIQPPRNGSANS